LSTKWLKLNPKRTENVRGDTYDVIKVARQLLNRSNSSRIISKQECMVELTSLPLVICSEEIENVSITGALRITKCPHKNSESSLLLRYQNRREDYEGTSLCEFFHEETKSKTPNKTIIPHFVGMSSTPSYPVTSAYARAMLIIHIPWRQPTFHMLNDSECINRFEECIKLKIFPRNVTLSYNKERNRYKENRLHNEPIQQREIYDIDNLEMTQEETEIVHLMTSIATNLKSTACFKDLQYSKGLTYDWSKRISEVRLQFDLPGPITNRNLNQVHGPQQRDEGLTGHLWLKTIISNFNEEDSEHATSNILRIPLRSDGTKYILAETEGMQRIILHHVLDTVKKWIKNDPDYQPFHRIISGGGGSGKSYLIHQITTVIRELFNSNETVQTSAFTGSAAYNIGGKTLHSAYAVNCTRPDNDLSQVNREKLTKQLRHTIAVLIDERSMLSAEVVGAVERNVSFTCHGGNKSKMKWGGIPIVLLFGDDYQLPPVQVMGKGKGAFHVFDYTPSKNNKGISAEICGMEELRRTARGAFILTNNKRINEGQQQFKEILQRVRIGKPSEEDKQTILSLRFDKLPRDLQVDYQKCHDTIFLFSTREMCCEHNFKKLSETNSEDNPVAFLKHKLPRHLTDNAYDNNTIPTTTCFSRGCKVAIKGRNFCPKLGLYNGAIGTVQEIVYEFGKSPNAGDLPLYVAVDFPGYKGHMSQFGSIIWDRNNPTTIPIPTVETIDEKTKKVIKYCPLVLSFARTIHTFQGQSAGPTNSQATSQIKRIICDIGTNRFESQNIGLFYTALSRATTIGSIDQQRKNSAIFFTQSLDKERLDRLTRKMDNTEYDMIKKRNEWVQYIEENQALDELNVSSERIQETFHWATTQKFTVKDIERRISH